METEDQAVETAAYDASRGGSAALPARATASGLYEWSSPQRPSLSFRGRTESDEEANGLSLIAVKREAVRLDVDGNYPQMTISGTVTANSLQRVDWIARLRASGPDRWTGPIWYKNGSTASFRFTQVDVVATRSLVPAGRKVKIAYKIAGQTALTRTYSFKSVYFRPAEFEFDSTTDSHPVTAIDPTDHPNRPSHLPGGKLSLATVYRRAGFDVRERRPGTVPVGGAGANTTWSDAEMHDAMQAYWSRWANRAQWSLWTFIARMHDQGASLGGIMFDDIGPNHRQGTAIFTDAFIANAPAGDPDPAAWVARMRFWTAAHEMGHAFNLAHSWQKSLGTPWINLADEPEARSFMNYPYNVSGGQTAFFANFEFRFSDAELLFMRHAPERFVQMGNADWFDDHGFREASVSPEPRFQLTARVNRAQPVFQFMEPVVVELKLTNISGEPQIVDKRVLEAGDHLTMITKRNGEPARQWHPFARYCLKPEKTALAPGDSIYQAIFIGAGLNGWDLAEPGRYLVQAALHLEEEDVVSAAIGLLVETPEARRHERLAQDFFTPSVGRVLAFDGTNVLPEADVLRTVAEEMQDSAVAFHARVALDVPLMQPGKTLAMAADGGIRVQSRKAEPTVAKKELLPSLVAPAAATTLGHVDYGYYAGEIVAWLEKDDPRLAAEYRRRYSDVLRKRGVPDAIIERLPGLAGAAPKEAPEAKTGMARRRPAA